MKHQDEFELEAEDRVWSDVLREAIHAESQRPAVFWSSQRAAIRGRISSRGHRSSVWMAFASAAALVLFAVLLLSGGNTTAPRVIPDNQQVATRMDPDQLLSEVQETIDNPIPDSLAPLDLLAQDMDKDFRANQKLAKQ